MSSWLGRHASMRRQKAPRKCRFRLEKLIGKCPASLSLAKAPLLKSRQAGSASAFIAQ